MLSGVHCQDIEFFVSHFVYKLWKSASGEKDKRNHGKHSKINGVTRKKFHDAVVKFLTEYDGMKGIEQVWTTQSKLPNFFMKRLEKPAIRRIQIRIILEKTN